MDKRRGYEMVFICLLFMFACISHAQVIDLTNFSEVRNNAKDNIAIQVSFSNVSRVTNTFRLFFQLETRNKNGVTFVTVQTGFDIFKYVIFPNDVRRLTCAPLTKNSSLLEYQLINPNTTLQIITLTNFRVGSEDFDALLNVNRFQIGLNSTIFTLPISIQNMSVSAWVSEQKINPYQYDIIYKDFPWTQHVNFTFKDMYIGSHFNIHRFLRMEFLHPAFLAASLFLLCSTVILTVLFSRKQPLLSRGIVPLLSVIGNLSCVVLMCISNWGIFVQHSRSFCYIYTAFRYPLYSAFYFGEVLQFARYNIFLMLNSRKRKVLLDQMKSTMELRNESSDNDEDLKIFNQSKSGFLVFAEVTQAWYFQLIMFLFWYVLSVCYFIAFQLGSGTPDCQYNLADPIFQSYLGMISFIFVLMLLNLPMSVFLTASYGGGVRKVLGRLFFKDHLYFKTELYLLTGFWYLSNIFQTIIEFEVIQVYIPAGLPRDLTLAAFRTASNYIVLLAQVTFPLTITIWWYIKSRCSKVKESPYKLSNCLADPKFVKVFLKYAQKEFSVENVTCYLAILNYEEIPLNQKKKKVRAAKLLVMYYLNGRSSELEINIPSHHIQKVLESMKNHNYAPDLFEEVKNQVLFNIVDTFDRFKMTKSFTLYCKEVAFEKDWDLSVSKRKMIANVRNLCPEESKSPDVSTVGTPRDLQDFSADVSPDVTKTCVSHQPVQNLGSIEKHDATDEKPAQTLTVMDELVHSPVDPNEKVDQKVHQVDHNRTTEMDIKHIEDEMDSHPIETAPLDTRIDENCPEHTIGSFVVINV